ncbi:hypothetical protein EVJ58_g3129 [Rhodofomes roseus]|uniref:Uncharacterized protein n=1 Tax=Rhodofomes roseus TaxID=34475 RepID=A0A4Y9YPM2_9APHY|nr:hypothetical protein EVJ58_g3129 [Rhodofomes roseus]
MLVGSMMVFEADRIETVRNVIESALYYENGVIRLRLTRHRDASALTRAIQWDKEKLQIFLWLQANL